MIDDEQARARLMAEMHEETASAMRDKYGDVVRFFNDNGCLQVQSLCFACNNESSVSSDMPVEGVAIFPNIRELLENRTGQHVMITSHALCAMSSSDDTGERTAYRKLHLVVISTRAPNGIMLGSKIGMYSEYCADQSVLAIPLDPKMETGIQDHWSSGKGARFTLMPSAASYNAFLIDEHMSVVPHRIDYFVDRFLHKLNGENPEFRDGYAALLRRAADEERRLAAAIDDAMGGGRKMQPSPRP